jgi:hypothetical protein
MTVLNGRHLIPLPVGARQINLTPPGLLKILKRTGKAVRDDGRWYAESGDVNQIGQARRVLGLDRTKVRAA